MSRRKRTTLEPEDFAMTPMIDMVFLLLVFFMTVSTLARGDKKLDLDLAESRSSQVPKQLEDRGALSIDKTGDIYLGQRLGLAEGNAADDPERTASESGTQHPNPRRCTNPVPLDRAGLKCLLGSRRLFDYLFHLSSPQVMSARRRKPAIPRAQLQIAPMIDVVFLLLIYFMVSASLARQEADLSFQLPGSLIQSTPLDIPDEPIIVIMRRWPSLGQRLPLRHPGCSSLARTHPYAQTLSPQLPRQPSDGIRHTGARSRRAATKDRRGDGCLRQSRHLRLELCQ